MHMEFRDTKSYRVKYCGPSTLRPPHETMEMWSYIARGLKINVQKHAKTHFETKLYGLIIQVVLK